MFTLNDSQRARLGAIRAYLDEGERRFEFWSRREAQSAAAQIFGETLRESGLQSGRALTPASRTRLLKAAAELAPNGNMSRRLLASDPKEFEDRLRRFFFSPESLHDRLNQFLAARGTGLKTASGLLCAFAPDVYPLVTSAALRQLSLTPQQRLEALRMAAERYDFHWQEGSKPNAAESLLALFVVYEAVRDALQLPVYPEVDSALRMNIPLASLSVPGAMVREAPASYETQRASLTESELLTALEEFALAQGFTFPSNRLRAYYVALKTKPFAILSGVSGTGKTRMAELFAEAMTGHRPQQFRLIPVRPDWNDSAALFGYQNVLTNRYVSTPFLEIVRLAALPENRQKAFFVCLDEMNLAQVEHYFADYLSALESRSHRISLHEDVPDLLIPGNLFVTGTVNVDETTHGFSRKVLDRANTLEFDEIPQMKSKSLGKGIAVLGADGGNNAAQRQALFLTARVGSAGRARERLSQIDARYPDLILDSLQAFNTMLYTHRLHFAYRVRDDILMFIANSFDSETQQGLLLPDKMENFTLAFDLQILQKVLPKLHGLSEAHLPLLSDLQAWAVEEEMRNTAAKLARMRVNGAETGYVRFYE